MVQHVIEDRTLDERTIEMLGQPLDPESINVNDFNTRKPKFEYIDRETVVKNANRIFGYDGWSYRVIGGVEFTDTPPKKDRNGEPIRQGFYKALVSVHVRGVGTRDHIGTWSIAKDSPDAHDTAAAGAVTSGLKRALRSFGDQFGLSLGLDGSDGRAAAAAPRSAGPAAPRKVGAAQSAKQWADDNGIPVLELCKLMNIPMLGDREVSAHMETNGIESPENLPAHLDALRNAKAA